ncbi:MAG: GWxTD domain-containing protein [Candidatus Aminicenantaceae bacterium]
MKKVSLTLIVFFSASLFIFSSPKDKSTDNLSEQHRRWLEEEVVYIITPQEKEVFLQLSNDRERELFIEAFWKHRDPTPNTPENEFKTEHYKRIQYANHWFGRESPGPGWRTDRGRIYIILGEPNSTERFQNLSEVFPVIIWFYGGMKKEGLPDSFNVVFFKRRGIGEYELYSPMKFGPQKLLIHYKGDPLDYLSAYYDLRTIEPKIADVSLTLIPGEAQYSLSPSIASEILLSNKIPSMPHKKVEDAYAKKLLEYKDIIEVEYSANYIDNDSLVTILKDDSGMFFVHFLIEPKKLSLEQQEDQFYTNLTINSNVSDLKGSTVFQYEKSIPVQINNDQINYIKRKLFSFQDMFPLVEGNYKLNILLKNRVSKEFTSIEKNIVIPEKHSFHMSSLILANKIIKNSKYSGKNKAFLIGNVQLVPSPRNDFISEDNLYVFFQIHNLNEGLKNNGYLQYTIFNEDEKVHSVIKKISDYPESPNFLAEFSLSDFNAGYYRIKVSVFDNKKEEIFSKQSNFYISHLAFLSRPWTLSVPMPSSDHSMYANILGNQYFNKNNIQKAKSLLEQAFREKTTSVQYALDFMRVLIKEKNYQKAKQVAIPFLEHKEKHKFYSMIGQSHQALEEFEKAISYYKKYLEYYGTNLFVLNSIGECYYQIGNREAALVAWEKSLEIDPKQEKIMGKIQSIKDKQ